MLIPKNSEIKNFFNKKSKYISPSEYDLINTILDKIKYNEECEFNKIKEKGDLEYRKGNYEKALSLYTKYIEENPTSVMYNNRSACYYKLNMLNECIEDCKKGLELDQDFIKFYARLAVVEKNENGKEWAKKGLELDSENTFLKRFLQE